MLRDIRIDRNRVLHGGGDIEVIYGFECNVVIKRDNKTYTVLFRRKFEVLESKETPLDFYKFIQSCIEETNRVYKLYKIPEKNYENIYGVVIGAVPFEIKDESISIEEYEGE
jgi:hypothetical protein